MPKKIFALQIPEEFAVWNFNYLQKLQNLTFYNSVTTVTKTLPFMLAIELQYLYDLVKKTNKMILNYLKEKIKRSITKECGKMLLISIWSWDP